MPTVRSASLIMPDEAGNGLVGSMAAVEVSAGLILMRKRCNPGEHEALVICRSGDLELPKGHVEGQETLIETAQRELVEETGVLNDILIGPKVGVAKYMVRSTRAPYVGQMVPKEVHYFSAFLCEGDALNLGAREIATKKLQWISPAEWELAKFRTNDQKIFVGDALRKADELRRKAQ
eukprot:Gregarina_sp_Pseudo_9__2488@NODE_2768_length_879_cov_7_995238_g2533_i0_p1_GENE_NODE_2768_length_879_cov_7_995238_g2533_i0NODE_2768_length_879_cov_7_995238_g2533_i0_p1_ORF_typecomplete_len186_score25_26NUDIX/PF00293_28/9_7e13_NODE_2768_length_879_cov_7_995238_g2533_i027560